VKLKQKENNKQKYMSKQLHSKTGIKDTNWKKRRRRNNSRFNSAKCSL